MNAAENLWDSTGGKLVHALISIGTGAVGTALGYAASSSVVVAAGMLAPFLAYAYASQVISIGFSAASSSSC